jgi:hypothetical protein
VAGRDLIDEARNERSRPWPLAILRKTLPVDGYDWDRQGFIDSWRDLLFKIKAAQPACFKNARIDHPHKYEEGKNRERYHASRGHQDLA